MLILAEYLYLEDSKGDKNAHILLFGIYCFLSI